jgi:nucleoid DNA-binding protein
MQNRSTKRYLSAVVESVRQKTGLPRSSITTICQLFMDGVFDILMAGDEVVLDGYGRFYWQRLPPTTLKPINSPIARTYPERHRIQFKPTRRYQGGFVMDENGMDKYGVELENEKVKKASKEGQPDTCPQCGKKLDTGGACPEHGTEPFEKRSK